MLRSGSRWVLEPPWPASLARTERSRFHERLSQKNYVESNSEKCSTSTSGLLTQKYTGTHKYIFRNIVYLVCVCKIYVCGHVHTTMHVWRQIKRSVESVPSSHFYVGSGDQTKAPGSHWHCKCLYPLSQPMTTKCIFYTVN